MDSFDTGLTELTGSLMSLEFAQGGRISRLWASDPRLPDEGDEFQFVIPPVKFGEEDADGYLPGTILLGARTSPDEPWAVSRNSVAHITNDPNEDEADPNYVEFEYEFPLLTEIKVKGRFFEEAGNMPQIVWEITLENTGRVPVEIGELGLPLAFNNFYDGFGWSDEQLEKLWKSRVYIHKFIGGGSSWLFAQRMTAEAPGLLVFPGENTTWEFYNHVRASLNTPFQWEGIPVVYIHSKAIIEREEWPTWMNEHTSLILEPGDRRVYQIRMAPTESDKLDGVSQTLAACGQPAMRLFPACVAPADVGVGLEVAGSSPSKFFLSREAQIESDMDEDMAFCFVKPKEPGPLNLSFEDKNGRLCTVHLNFTEPIRDLIIKRAEYIATRQLESSTKSHLHKAFLLTNSATGKRVTDATEYQEAAGLECSLADTLYLAEKNAIYPDAAQIRLLDACIEDFILARVQNPSSFAVASILEEHGQGSHFGRPLGYPHVANLYHSMYRIASTYGATRHEPSVYLDRAVRTYEAMFEYGWRHYVRTVGTLGFARIYDLIEDLVREDQAERAEQLRELATFKANELLDLEFPYAGESVMDTSGMEEVFSAALQQADDERLEKTLKCAFAARSLAPSWWWYGGDKRCWEGSDSTPINAAADRGEASLAHTTIPNSLIFFELMDRDYLALPEAYMRLAFGGMMGPWALVHPDGSASMCYCPDLSSRQAGFNAYTGASGLGYYHYLRGAGSYVLPSREGAVYAYGCRYDPSDNALTIRPWDGVGRRAVLRQLGASFELTCGSLIELRLDPRLRWFEADIENPSDRNLTGVLRVDGLWGTVIESNGVQHTADRGRTEIKIELPAGQTTTIKGQAAS